MFTSIASVVVVGAAVGGAEPVRKSSPICRLAASVNQMLQFGPATIAVGWPLRHAPLTVFF